MEGDILNYSPTVMFRGTPSMLLFLYFFPQWCVHKQTSLDLGYLEDLNNLMIEESAGSNKAFAIFCCAQRKIPKQRVGDRIL